MRLTFPLRVRCVDPAPTDLVLGQEYVALAVGCAVVRIQGMGAYYKERFKPVVRVKAKCVRARVLL